MELEQDPDRSRKYPYHIIICYCTNQKLCFSYFYHTSSCTPFPFSPESNRGLYQNIKVRVATCSILPPQINQTNKNFITPIIITPLENQNAAARNRTGGSSMATMNFTTKPQLPNFGTVGVVLCQYTTL